MAKKKLKSGFQLEGIAPNILLQDVQNTAPFLFQGKLTTNKKNQQFLQTLIFYKRNLKQLQNLNLSDYFHLCLCAHWATAGTFVPTDVDNQIRQKLWKNPSIKKHILKMADMTIDSLSWDYQQVTHRKSFDSTGKQVLSTHEGTWFSVAIGAYLALKEQSENDKADQVADVILQEIKNEENVLIQLRENREAINFISATPLVAHNFGDLDRVMVAWDAHESDSFCKSIYRLGHELNENYSKLIVFAGKVNKEFTAHENHRHMALRRPKCLRKSNDFLIHVGPFLDQWGKSVGESDLLSLEEKASIIIALYEGHVRETEAIGYGRGLSAILKSIENGIDSFDEYLPFDLKKEILRSSWYKDSLIPEDEFLQEYEKKLLAFKCEKTGISF